MIISTSRALLAPSSRLLTVSTSRRLVSTGKTSASTTSTDPSSSPLPVGSLSVGTPLKLDYLKDRPGPVARPDEEYPEWLWALLKDEPNKPIGQRSLGDDETSLRRKEFSRVRKAAIKKRNQLVGKR